ncbi:molybdopterin cofactor-binding domain-containing protein [Streptomyces sp. MS1.HAVA.3]|uniref:Molybdopterin cofactor-binding domain-containing protein n=1 Tax=Streptomyces caledonius TaxID=3134107 RepID=A0ABU8UDS0_9ACTN
MARQNIAADLGLPSAKVTVHVVQAGGSFGRRLFFDAALEAARISKACRRPVKLMWTRVDDTRHGRMRPRPTTGSGPPTSWARCSASSTASPPRRPTSGTGSAR